MNIPSTLIENAINEVAKLPGIGKKTAMRMVLHLLREKPDAAEALGTALTRMVNEIQYCSQCHNVSDDTICTICANPRRDRSLICLVEDLRDVIAIENTSQYRGLYHVLGGVISPLEGIGPTDLNIESLLERVRQGEVKEMIMALSPTMEGDTTTFYIHKRMKEFGLRTSSIARGIPVGGELEYADEITLGRSIVRRTAYEEG